MNVRARHLLRLTKPLASLLVCLGLLAAAAPEAKILRVGDGGPDLGFADLQLAIDAAEEGDLLLLQTGHYGAVQIEGKSLRILADTGAQPVLCGGVEIRNLTENQSVELLGLEFQVAATAEHVARISDCAGTVIIQDCQLGSSGMALGLLVERATAVTLVRTAIDLSLMNSEDSPSFAVYSRDSNVFIYDCDLIAGAGTIGQIADEAEGTVGPPAIQAEGGLILVSGCRLLGGRGRSSVLDLTLGVLKKNGEGGPAVTLRAGEREPLFVQLDTELYRGSPGYPAKRSATSPRVDQLIEIESGTLSNSPLSARSYSASPISRIGDRKVNVFRGQPFDFVWHMFSVNRGTVVFSPLNTGTIYPGTPFFIKFRGLLDSDGQRTRIRTVTPILTEFTSLYEQALFYNANEKFTVSNPNFAVILSDEAL